MPSHFLWKLIITGNGKFLQGHNLEKKESLGKEGKDLKLPPVGACVDATYLEETGP